MQEMTLDEYNKQLEEKRAGLNKKPSGGEVKADPKAFEGMKSYTRKDGIDEVAPPPLGNMFQADG